MRVNFYALMAGFFFTHFIQGSLAVTPGVYFTQLRQTFISRVYAGDCLHGFLQPALVFFVEGVEVCAIDVQDADDR